MKETKGKNPGEFSSSKGNSVSWAREGGGVSKTATGVAKPFIGG